ncbi:uncharacterized protein L969DRAFT_16313 [Mixia osmundae IAM 14324]|uniref:Uncharacterized protein n=1 Tax=Mixia osmundae (strain CBS 9802 / IAM 14324 / JCM 22182 / KY 12970) TaxID=764103 RepID=G7DU35_MIXOS|nr:uncharacterized protein L969DRAFT_16313 [Mixia osmundae IAM 14324]KEI40962.1 hypothetical protein L969DRAFT_16313 [Mixia osmundae IAM 14324]GAA94095.1 hypothetical protein E5Q_00742 [Mixia osmundae IAM 14324]
MSLLCTCGIRQARLLPRPPQTLRRKASVRLHSTIDEVSKPLPRAGPTHPAPGPKILPRPARPDEQRSLPDSLPREEYASPVITTLSIFRRMFKYAVYGSVGLVVTGLTVWQGTHMWVEYVELGARNRQRARSDAEQLYGFEEDSPSAWSGGYLGGGTDPRLPWKVKACIRGAWISLKWDGGPISTIASTAPGPFTDANIGPRTPGAALIDLEQAQAAGQTAKVPAIYVADRGYALAEAYLVAAIGAAELKGISLDSSDQAILELEERLADVRERMGGYKGLREARNGRERIYEALKANNPDPSPVVLPRYSWASRGPQWRHRELVRASRKLGQVTLRLAEETLKKGSLQQREIERARHLLAWSVAEGLVLDHDRDDIRREAVAIAPPAVRDATNDSWWHRIGLSSPVTAPHQEDRKPSQLLLELGRLALDPLALSPMRQGDQSFVPSLARALLLSVQALSTAEAKSGNLHEALELDLVSMKLIDALRSPPPGAGQPQSTAAALVRRLHMNWLDTRQALFATYAAEILRAQGQAETASLNLLRSSVDACKATNQALSALTDLTAIPKAFTRFTKTIASSTEQFMFQRLQQPATDILRDARLVGTMAANLGGIIHEQGCGDTPRNRQLSAKKRAALKAKSWCGGDRTAMQFYETAMDFAAGRSPRAKEGVQPKGEDVDVAGWREAWNRFVRTRARVQKAPQA